MRQLPGGTQQLGMQAGSVARHTAGALPDVSFSLVSHHFAARTVTITIYARVLSVTDRRMLVSGRTPG